MVRNSLLAAIALVFLSSCQRSNAVELREISLNSSEALSAARKMYKDNPDTLTLKRRLVGIYYIEAKMKNCVWFVYDPRVGFNDSEFLYRTDKNSNSFSRL